MTIFKNIFLPLTIFAMIFCSGTGFASDSLPPSTKKERNHITKGNKLFEEGKFKEAMVQYQAALDENPSSSIGRYNLGLSEIRIGSNVNDTTQAAKNMLEAGVKNMQQIANLGSKRPLLAAKANYNLGNVAFNSEDYKKAVDLYKQSLRLNPEDENARRNLRIAQLKLQNQDDNQNQDQQDQEQEQNEDQQDQQDQEQEQNQDQEEQNQDQQEQDQQQQQSNLNQQTAEQILNAIENKENQTRARVAGQNAEKNRDRNRNRRNW